MKKSLAAICIILIALLAAEAWAGPSITYAPTVQAASGKRFTVDGTSGSTINVGTGGTLGTAAFTAATAYAPAFGTLTNGNLCTTNGTTVACTTATNTFAASNAATTVNGQSCALGGSCTIAAGSLKGYASFPAGALIPDTSSGLLQNDSDPNIFDYLAFDGATDEYALFVWIPPDDYDAGTIKAKFSWAASAAMTDAHTVIFGLNCYAVGDGDTLDVAFNSGAQTASDAYATGDETGPKLKISAATSAITVQGTPAAGKPVFCRVHRDADTDTSTVDAWLVNVAIEYGKTGATPAAW
jgi:hypothetical protein